MPRVALTMDNHMSRVSTIQSGAEFVLPVNSAMTCGAVINEIVTDVNNCAFQFTVRDLLY